MNKHILAWSCMLATSLSTMAQTKDSLPAIPASKSSTALRPYKSLIPQNARTRTGLFTVHKVDDKFYFEVADSILGRDILVVSRLAKASADMRSDKSMNGYGGDELNENVIRFEKGPNNKLFVRNLSFNERSADSSQPMYRAVMNSNIQPIVLSFDIKAEHRDSIKGTNAVVVDMTDLINSDNDLLFFGPAKQSFRIGSYQPDKSFPLDVKTFPLNTEIKTVKTYASLPQVKAAAGGAPTAAPGGNFTVELNTSFVLLPKTPMPARFADNRVGYFTDEYTDFDADPDGVEEKKVINRWRLMPRAADMEKYRRGELVEPEKPIVIYIDPATPSKWVPYLIQGINDWNAAFEKAGFKNAIIGKRAPTYEEDSTWSMEDARHSVLVYKPSAIPNASGPHISDPRSGEIMETHINWYHNVMELIHNWYFIQAAAVDTQARHMQFNDELMGQLIRFVSSHEVGHTLGLRHNFGASSATPVEKLRDNQWLSEHGHTSSIMDYARFNYVAQPEDSISQRNLFPRIGDYDKWAIEWGYRWIHDAPTPEQETPILNKWVVEKVKDKRYWFGSEETMSDPRSQSEDLGDNAMKASEYGIKNLKRILAGLTQWTSEPNKGYGNLYDMYCELLWQFQRYIGHVARNVGGRYQTPKTIEQQGPVFEWVPVATQKEAVAFLNKNVFTVPTWILDEKVLSYTGASPITTIGMLQESAFNGVLNPFSLTNLQMASLSSPDNYSIAALLNDLQKGIWSELDTRQPINGYRRNLQRLYVDRLSTYINLPLSTIPPAGTVPKGSGSITAVTDIAPLAKANLRSLKSKILAVLPVTRDELTRTHLQDMLDRIDDTLKVKKP